MAVIKCYANLQNKYTQMASSLIGSEQQNIFRNLIGYQGSETNTQVVVHTVRTGVVAVVVLQTFAVVVAP